MHNNAPSIGKRNRNRTCITCIGSLVTVSTLALAFAQGAMAQAPAASANLVTSRGDAVRAAAAGVCVRTSYWSPALATPECDPELVPRRVAAAPVVPRQAPALPPPPAQPEPIAAAPAPAPTPAPVAPVMEKVTMQSDTLFDFDKAELRPDARAALDDLAKKSKDMNLEVEIAVGHTDRLGSTAYNQRLSERRAQAVKEYMVAQGVPANRIYSEGKGKSQPVKECTERNRSALISCLQPNRRVEVELVGTRATDNAAQGSSSSRPAR